MQGGWRGRILPSAVAARGVLWRLAPSLAGLAIYLAFVMVRAINFQLYLKLFQAIDAIPNLLPFSDTRAVLQAFSCARQGVDVYLRNACMGGGQYNYSSFLLRAGADLQLGPGQSMAVGLLSGMLVLGALALLPPAQSRREMMLRMAAMGSGALVALLDSANIDCLLFAASLCGALALRQGVAGRVCGYGVFALLAAVKFYPAVLFVLLVREARFVFWTVCIAALVAGGLYVWHFGAGVITALMILPSGPPYDNLFGAHNLVAGFVVLFSPAPSPVILPATLVLVALALYVAWREAPLYDVALLAVDETRRLLLLAGALIMTECFFSAQNFNYRAVFFLLTLPGLCAMARLAPHLARRFDGVGLAVLFLMWEPLARYLTGYLAAVMFGSGAVWLKMAFWLIRELVWWRVGIFFAAIVIAYARGGTGMLFRQPAPGG